VNVAARLQSAAPLGGIVMDIATYEGAACTLPATPTSLTLKGKREPEQGYIVAADAVLSQ
jgi:class 3 adenylate cyclase